MGTDEEAHVNAKEAACASAWGGFLISSNGI